MKALNASRGLSHLGLILIGGAALFAELAFLHMRVLVQSYGVICGSGPGVAAHCPACYASALLLVLGLASLGLARAASVTTLAARVRPTQSA